MKITEAPASKFESIQALRGFAALYVFLFHVKIPVPLWSDQATESLVMLMNRGFMGVDIFFVISGFIMAWIGVLSGRSSDGPVAFGVKRFFRVVPPYWVATLVTIYLAQANETPEALLRSLLFYPVSPTDGGPFYGYALNVVGWTLNYEMLFYALFCVSLLFGRYTLYVLGASILGLVFAVPMLITGDGFSLSVTRALTANEPYLMLATNPIMLEFVLGIGCAVVYSKINGMTPKAFGGALLLIGIVMMGWTFWTHTGTHSVVRVGLPAAVLLLGAVLAEDAGILKIPRFASWLGEVSFSIYLIHVVVVLLVRHSMHKPGGDGAMYGQLLFEIGVILLAARYWHRFIEAPSAKLGIVLAGKLKVLKRTILATLPVSARTTR